MISIIIYDFGFIGRESGVNLKKLLVKLFSDVPIDYLWHIQI
jgi:hypothetical protein